MMTSNKQRNRHRPTPHVGAYDAKIDSKRRIVLRSPRFEYFSVYEREDGSVLLAPKVLVDVSISTETRQMIDSAVKNFKKGKVSKPIDVNAYLPKHKMK
jgi:hypothetical protein